MYAHTLMALYFVLDYAFIVTKIAYKTIIDMPVHRRTPLPKCNFNKVALQFYWNRTSAWAHSCKFAAYFQNTFSTEPLWMAASVSLQNVHQQPMKTHHCFCYVFSIHLCFSELISTHWSLSVPPLKYQRIRDFLMFPGGEKENCMKWVDENTLICM